MPVLISCRSEQSPPIRRRVGNSICRGKFLLDDVYSNFNVVSRLRSRVAQ